jgi:Mrp family chromosome partitioning ATPase/capsular polysaccharide biosynthesis protein
MTQSPQLEPRRVSSLPPAQSSRTVRTTPFSALATGGALFAVVLASFTGYAFLSRAVYRTAAVVKLEDPKAVGSEFPEPLEAARRLREVTLDRQMLERLAEKIEPVQTPAARVELARRIRAATEVDTVDGKSYVIAFSDSEAERATSICNQIAERAAERLPKVLETTQGPSPEELERQKRTERMMAFLAAHPDAWSVSDATPEAKTRTNDQALAALRAERDRLVADLARAQAALAEANSDNPYAESPSIKPEQINARLREVDRALAARQKALDTAQPKESKLSPELREEWQKLLKEVAQAPTPPPPPPPLKARVVERAKTPAGPISPNRRLLVGLGAMLGLVVGGLGAALTLGVQKAARRRASAPPGPRIAASSSAAPPTRTILNSTLVLDKPPEPVRPSTVKPAGDASTAPEPHGTSSSVPPNFQQALEDGSFKIPPARVPSISPAPILTVAATPAKAFAPPSPVNPAPTVPVTEPAPAEAAPPAAKNGAEAPAPVTADAPKPASEVTKPAAEAPKPAAEATKPAEAPKPAAEATKPAEAPKPAAAPKPTELASMAPKPAEATTSAPKPAGAPKSPLPPRPERKPAPVVASARGASSAPPARREAPSFEPPRPVAPADAPPSSALESIHPPFTPPNDDRARLERKVRATPKTLVLGSVIAPVPPAGRSTPPPPSSAKQNLRGTGYSHVSSNPPRAETELVEPRIVAPGWAPDPNVVPDSRRALCDQLFPLALERCFVIAVSGTPDPVESKSRVAAELAVSLAKSQHPRVLLLEGNRNRPAVHRLMRVDFETEGLSRQIESRARGNVAPWIVRRCSETLDVLGEGLNRAPAMMLTPTFAAGVNELKSYYDFVVIDGPFLYDSADCKALADIVDGVVLVCSDERAKERLQQLTPFGVKTFQSVVAYTT